MASNRKTPREGRKQGRKGKEKTIDEAKFLSRKLAPRPKQYKSMGRHPSAALANPKQETVPVHVVRKRADIYGAHAASRGILLGGTGL